MKTILFLLLLPFLALADAPAINLDNWSTLRLSANGKSWTYVNVDNIELTVTQDEKDCKGIQLKYYLLRVVRTIDKEGKTKHEYITQEVSREQVSEISKKATIVNGKFFKKQ